MANSGCVAGSDLPSSSRSSADTWIVSPGRNRSRLDHGKISAARCGRPAIANSERSSAGWLNGSTETSRPHVATSTCSAFGWYASVASPSPSLVAEMTVSPFASRTEISTLPFGSPVSSEAVCTTSLSLYARTCRPMSLTKNIAVSNSELNWPGRRITAKYRPGVFSSEMSRTGR